MLISLSSPHFFSDTEITKRMTSFFVSLKKKIPFQLLIFFMNSHYSHTQFNHKSVC